jgi:hypothetical protein
MYLCIISMYMCFSLYFVRKENVRSSKIRINFHLLVSPEFKFGKSDDLIIKVCLDAEQEHKMEFVR